MHNDNDTPQWVLASGSFIRKTLLEKAGVSLVVSPSLVNETQLKKQAGKLSEKQLAVYLAIEKAQERSQHYPEHWVIGCDQIAVCDGRHLSKSTTVNDCKEQLSYLQGKKHQLYTAACIVHSAKVLWSMCGVVELLMKPLSSSQIDDYVKLDNPLHSCGSYYYEENGQQLFSSVVGDESMILGLPLEALCVQINLMCRS